MASLLSSLNPINAFPDYHGPYAVGTVDVEIPASDLPSPCERPEGAVPTIAFRIFYPCVKPSRDNNRPVRWMPQPQRLTIAALLRFLGIKERTASGVSFFAQQFYWIKLRAYRNAQILDPPTFNGQWPVAIFSHGLAGSRNAYSYICGDLASQGMVVIAMDHRDGSSPVQYVRATAETEAQVVNAIKISHTADKAVYEARDKQLRIRLWEISMAYEALMKIDAGQKVENLDMNTSSRRKERSEVLQQFDGKLDIHRAGKVTFCGHSFGAATMTQLVKTIYYTTERPANAGKPLIAPNRDAAILHQITDRNSMLLLDLWGLPLQSPDQAWLWNRPLPSYTAGGSEGNNVLSVLSEAFRNWKENLIINEHIVAEPSKPRSPSVAPRLTGEEDHPLPAWSKLRDESPSKDSGYASRDSTSPVRQNQKAGGSHMFYVQNSQHFNHSDFGILFPWIAKRFMKVEDPERILKLNNRAMVQVLRETGIEVAGEDDNNILNPQARIRRWVAVPLRQDGQATIPAALDEVDRKLSITSQQSMDATVPVQEPL